MRMMFFLILLLNLLASSLAQQNKAKRFVSSYRNDQYGFSFKFTSLQECVGSSKDAPAHGCRIHFTQSLSDIDIYAEYNTLEVPLASYINTIINGEASSAGETSKILQKSILIDGIRGIETTISESSPGRKRMRKVVVLTHKPSVETFEIFYVIDATCVMGDFQPCNVTMSSILHSFKIVYH